VVNARIMMPIHWQMEIVVELIVEGCVTTGPSSHLGKRVIASAIEIFRTISITRVYRTTFPIAVGSNLTSLRREGLV
jgi:hypothetical protein